MRNVIAIILFFAFFSCAFENPYFIVIDVSNDNNSILIDSHFSEISDIKTAIYVKTKDLDSIQRSKFFVKLLIPEDVMMGKVLDVENELKKINILNLRYYNVESKSNHYE